MLTESASHALSRDGLGPLPSPARLRAAIGTGEPVAVISAQPHDVTLVAGALGPEAAERLLDHMGRRLAGIAGPAGTVACTGDGAFALVVAGLGAETDA